MESLLARNAPVTAVIRNPDTAAEFRTKGAIVAVADAFDLPALQSAFTDGSGVFVQTPETGHSHDVIGDTKSFLPTFYPVDLKIPMISPLDVAKFIAALLVKPIAEDLPIYELEGPQWYSSIDVAETIV